MNILGILAGAAIIVGLALALSALYKANGTDAGTLCCGDCSGCSQRCEEHKSEKNAGQP